MTNQRLIEHLGHLNFGFRVHYNKIYKAEYLPARTRYNQFFFYSALLLGLNQFRKNGWAFVDDKQSDLGKRIYYSSPRQFVNYG